MYYIYYCSSSLLASLDPGSCLLIYGAGIRVSFKCSGSLRHERAWCQEFDSCKVAEPHLPRIMMDEKSLREEDSKPNHENGEDELNRLLRAGNLDAMIPTDLSGKDRIEHADDALDFESEDELAEDEDDASDSAKQNETTPANRTIDQNAGIEGETEADWTSEFADDMGLFDDQVPGPNNVGDELSALETEDAARRAEESRRRFEEEERELALAQLREWYPGFQPHTILKMNQLFGPEPSQTRLPFPRLMKPIHLNRMKLEVEPDQAAKFVSEFSEGLSANKRLLSSSQHGIIHEITRESLTKAESDIGRKHVLLNAAVDLRNLDTDDANSRLEKGPFSQLQLEVSNWDDVLDIDFTDESCAELSSSRLSEKAGASSSHIADIRIQDEDIYASDEEDLILSGELLNKKTKLDLNDSRLMFVDDRRNGGHANRSRSTDDPQLNISNDRAYDMLRANHQQKVRSTIGSLNIDHAMPALRLQSPFYPVSETKSQLRTWHRSKFNVKPGTVIHFHNIKHRKRWRDKNSVAQELFSKSSDLTLGDSASLFAIEYSEENPLVLSGFGMGSKVINYYRKKYADDTSRPKKQVGETRVLEEQDRSTFWNFGFVEPGHVVPTLYNQMIRSPVFQHEQNRTDFLLIRSSTRTRMTRFFLRPIPYLFVSGQVFPAVQIPGPHSRKVTAASKNRLKMVVYRVLNKDPNHRLQIKDISVHFPDHNEVQNRQRLKEFMEYQRSGDDQGFWKVKPGDNLPNEPEIRGMISPEDIMLLESMRVGQQHLEDSGYSKTITEEQSGDKDNDGLSLDEQLAPWNMSRNFINAIQGKAMLQLNGVGDPTARGEGFSFLRTSMKGGFATEVSAEDEKKLGGHSYNVALQQRAYDEEIKRIWYAQKKSLSTTNPKQLPDANRLPDDAISGAQTLSSGSSGKVLQITRVVRDENDILVRETELVTDTQVIRAYLRHRKTAEEERMAVDQISVTDDVEANKMSRKFLELELARLHRNADRRQARKATKQDPKLKATTRKCATCGAVGHIKTNKSCPMYNDIYLNAASSNQK